MAPARVDAELNINATDLRAVLLENSRQLLYIDVALEKLSGVKVVGSFGDHVDYFSAIGLDVKAGRREKHVPRHHGAVFDVQLCPDALRSPALGDRNHVREAKDLLKFFR
jgi:hypothetical protein